VVLHAPVLAAAALLLPQAAVAWSAPSAQLRARFMPDRLGASTTIGFTLRIAGAGGAPPPPLTSLDVRLPAGMNLLESQLGLATCSEEALRTFGPAGCPANSRLGYGTAAATLLLRGEREHAQVRLQVFLGDASGKGLPVLVLAEIVKPVFGLLLLPSWLRADSGRFSDQLYTSVPLIPTLPGDPDASIADITVSFGPRGLVYHRREHGRVKAFRPRGLAVPRRCPRGGFPLEARITFLGGAKARAASVIPCPRRRGQLSF
jgi:hypothetical protein